MSIKNVPNYLDPDDFETLENEAKYPCSTNYMRYNAMVHRYYLTLEALHNEGIDVESDYMSDAADKVGRFIEEVTDDVYGVIMHLAPFNYRYHCAQIAMAKSLHFDKYTARKQFERALLYQARYKLDNIDVRDVNGIDLEGNNNIYFKQLRRELRHVSPKCLDILHGLGLLYNGNIPASRFIDYGGVM